ncbi:Ig-like domain-containing protein, partial [Candidatus Peregrinibacteria bacterium]|nr:Ig-like domain-containing protein [Candidatus Peregrinibacteria bacterium]
MNEKKYTDRKVDNLKLQKSKKYLWQYIKAKANQDEKSEQSAWDILKNWLLMPRHFVPALSGVVAVLLIVSLVFTTNFAGWFDGSGGGQVKTVHASFEMSAEDEDSSGVAPDSSFELEATEDISEDDVIASLSVSPALELKVDKVDSKKFKVTPLEGLEANKIYNFSIKTDKGELNWAYQVRDTFKLMGTLPGDRSSEVPTNSGIEFNFSHEGYDFDEFQELFEISPKVKGSFEQHRRTVVFVPEEPLEPGTIYTVTLKGGLSLQNSEQEISEDYVVEFETGGKEQSYDTSFSFSRDYYEVSSDSAVGLRAYTYNLEDAGVKNLNVDIYQYQDLDSFLKTVEEKHSIPDWAYYSSRAYKYDSTKLRKVGSFEAELAKRSWNGYIHIPGLELDEGYYLVEVNDDIYFDQALLQITDLSSYVSVTLTDTLVWVNDLKTGKPVDGAEVSIEGDDKTYKTAEDGTVSFATPEAWKKKYDPIDDQKVQSHLTISKGEKRLVTPIEAYSYWGQSNTYWSLFDTDRPMYKPSDTVKFWGFIESKEARELGELKVKIEYGWNTFVSETPVKIEDDGSFIGEIELKNFTPGYYNLYLFEGDNTVVTSYLEVSDYVKPAYDLKVEADKNAVFAGEKVNFNISANFFDGTPVPDLDVDYYSSQSGSVIEATNEKGEIKKEMIVEYQKCDDDPEYCYNSNTLYLDANANLAEETNIWSSDSVRVFNSKIELNGEGEIKGNKGELKISANWIDLNKLNEDE